jgi:hypothetical protein
MKNTLSHIISSIVFLSATTSWAADAPKADPPRTKLEQFSAKYGSLFLRGKTRLVTLDWDSPESLELAGDGAAFDRIQIDVVELIDPSTKTRAYGVYFDLKEDGEVRESRSYLDEDEIPSLIKGVDYLLALDPAVTKLKSVTGFYRIKDGLEVQVSKGNKGGKKIIYGIKAKTGGFAIFTNVKAFGRFRQALVDAQKKILEIKQ